MAKIPSTSSKIDHYFAIMTGPFLKYLPLCLNQAIGTEVAK